MGRIVLGAVVGTALVACVVAGVVVGRRVRSRRKWMRVIAVLKDFEESCETPVARLKQVVDAMTMEMHAGLASEGGSKLKMLLTHVDRLPTGSESGTYYGLDLGSTNFRALRIQLGGKRGSISSQKVEMKPIPQHLMMNTTKTKDLFDFIASTLKEFVEDEEDGLDLSLHTTKDLGFTFSFPVKQTSIQSGFLIKWTKGFSLEDLEGREIAEQLQDAVIRSGLHMNVAALVNDTVGTLALGHYRDADTVVAVILGTGTNACYVERADAVIKCQGLLTSSKFMVINMEWGSFWSSQLPRTSFDFDLDADSPNPNDQGFEKMISGMYLGEIVRRVILRMSMESDIFGPISIKLSTPFSLGTQLMVVMHEDDSLELEKVSKILKETLDIQEVPLKTRKLVVRVCDVVASRAARLAAAAIVGILKKIGRDGASRITGCQSRSSQKLRKTMVAIDGWLYTQYTIFQKYLHEAMNEILGDMAPHVCLCVAEDGSAIGAALLAALYSSRSVDKI